MKALRRGWRRLVGSMSHRASEARIAEELNAHFEMLVDAKVRDGLAPDEARREARLEFGEIETVKEHYRDQRGLPRFESIVRDARFALRGLRRNPGFAVAAIACLALGIGAVTTIFSIANAALIRQLPVEDPGRLVLFSWESDGERHPERPQTSSGMGELSLPYAAFRDFKNQSRTLSGALAFVPMGFDRASVSVTRRGGSVAAAGELVSGSYFAVLGVGASVGRPLLERDDDDGVQNAVVLSHAFWRREFGADPGVVGQSLTLNGEPFTVVGVATPEFRGLNPGAAPDLWIPLKEYRSLHPWGVTTGPDDPSRFEDTGYFWCMMAGRLGPGVAADAARAELDTVFHRTLRQGLASAPSGARLPRLALQPFSHGLETLRNRVSKPLTVLGAGVALLLLIAATNVATLLLARGESRHREIGIRLAIGASRGRLVQQLLVEGLILALAGGLAGVALAHAGAPLLLRLLTRGENVPAPDPGVDLTVLLFSLAVSIVTGLAFGLAPARTATRFDVAARLKRESGTVSSRHLGGRVLIISQVALSIILLVGAGLFVRTFANLDGQKLGFDADNLLLFRIDAARAGYEGDRAVDLYRRLLDGIRRVPGVAAVTTTDNALLSGWNNNSPMSTDGPAPEPGSDRDSEWNGVGPDFLSALRIPLIHGRGLGERETWGRHRVAVVNRAWVARFLPRENPIGHRLSMEEKYVPGDSYEVVGVVEDAKYTGVRTETRPTVYIPFTVPAHAPTRLWVEVRTTGQPLAFVAAVRQAVRAVDPGIPLLNLRTQREQMALSLSQERMLASLSTALGALALLLVGAGLFGTLGYSVSRRTTEIGIRMALGARAERVLGAILWDAALMVAAGAAIGLPIALLLARSVRALLFGVTATDGLTLVATVAVLFAIGIAAAVPPALRAARIDPTRALRTE